jgi:hypothetical protein
MMDRKRGKKADAADLPHRPEDETGHGIVDDRTDLGSRNQPNPPRTTTGKMTSPKFGSAGSGGAELEPGPERD